MNKLYLTLLLSFSLHSMQHSPSTPSTPKEIAEHMSILIYGRHDKKFSETFEKILSKRTNSPELQQKRENYALIISSMSSYSS